MRPLPLLLALLAPTMAVAGDPPAVFEIHNDTGQAVTELYVEPASAAYWDDRLHGDPLAPGRWAELGLDPAQGCLYDVEVRTADGGIRRALEVDVCKSARLDLSAAGLLASGEAPAAGAPERLPPRAYERGPPYPPPPTRGLPFCPGDPRCRKTK